MKTHMPVIAGAFAIAFTLAVPPASAQDATTSASTTTTTSTSTRTSATPDMVKEAIERSQARTEKARATGTPESFGSEEPFVYDATRTLNELSTFR